MNDRIFGLQLPILALLVLVGCGPAEPPLGEVTGKVTFKGQPASNVVIFFSPKQGGRESSATTDDQGNYQLGYSSTVWGAVVGSHVVTIAPGSPPFDATEISKSSPIPPAFAGLKKDAEVKEGKNIIDLDYP